MSWCLSFSKATLLRGENPGCLGVTTRLEQWVSLMSRQVFQAVILRVCEFFASFSGFHFRSLSLVQGEGKRAWRARVRAAATDVVLPPSRRRSPSFAARNFRFERLCVIPSELHLYPPPFFEMGEDTH